MAPVPRSRYTAGMVAFARVVTDSSIPEHAREAVTQALGFDPRGLPVWWVLANVEKALIREAAIDELLREAEQSEDPAPPAE